MKRYIFYDIIEIQMKITMKTIHNISRPLLLLLEILSASYLCRKFQMNRTSSFVLFNDRQATSHFYDIRDFSETHFNYCKLPDQYSKNEQCCSLYLRIKGPILSIATWLSLFNKVNFTVSGRGWTLCIHVLTLYIST